MPSPSNILLFLADGMQGRTLAPDHLCLTPNFDRLAKRGVQFTRAYSPTPVCSPARASLMTGLLAHNHGVLQVEHALDADQGVLRTDNPHWAERLTDAGYHTGYFGKWHIERSIKLEEYGWQVNGAQETQRFREMADGRGGQETEHLDPALSCFRTEREGYRPLLHYGVTDLPVERRTVSVPVDLAEVFLDDAISREQPWCCCVSYPMPNEAMVCSRDTFEQYNIDAVDLPVTLHDKFSDRPAIYRRAQQVWQDLTEEQWRTARACYYARITELDHQFNRLMDKLETAGQRDNTIVIVTSDHGKYVGGHGFDAHNFGAFEEIYNIPLIISGPEIPSGVSTEARVGLHDLCPTLLDLTGAASIVNADAKSFLAVLKNPRESERDYTTGYAEYHGTRYPLMQRIVWDGPWKFIFNGFDFDELYNLNDDPWEQHNLATDPIQQPRTQAMMRMIWTRIRETGDQTLLNADYYSMRFAAVGPDA